MYNSKFSDSKKSVDSRTGELGVRFGDFKKSRRTEIESQIFDELPSLKNGGFLRVVPGLLALGGRGRGADTLHKTRS